LPSSIPKPSKLLHLIFKPYILFYESSFEDDFPTVNDNFTIVMVVLSFPFLIILAESLKNRNKTQKKHKIDNIIFAELFFYYLFG